MNNELGRQLHDRATRGDALTEEEQVTLTQWYDQMDREETALLSPAFPLPPEPLEALQTQVDKALDQLQEATRRLGELSAQNEATRQEIAALYRQLAQTKTKQTA